MSLEEWLELKRLALSAGDVAPSLLATCTSRGRALPSVLVLLKPLLLAATPSSLRLLRLPALLHDLPSPSAHCWLM